VAEGAPVIGAVVELPPPGLGFPGGGPSLIPLRAQAASAAALPWSMPEVRSNRRPAWAAARGSDMGTPRSLGFLRPGAVYAAGVPGGTGASAGGGHGPSASWMPVTSSAATVSGSWLRYCTQ
jgi:hypothetical protein